MNIIICDNDIFIILYCYINKIPMCRVPISSVIFTNSQLLKINVGCIFQSKVYCQQIILRDNAHHIHSSYVEKYNIV